MTRFSKDVSSKTGLPPGTLKHIGKKRLDVPVVTVFNYSEEKINEICTAKYDELHRPEGSNTELKMNKNSKIIERG
jgi:hypothetical protein